MKYQGVYKIENLLNGKVYIGSSVNVYNRLRQHFTQLSNNVHGNAHLQRAVNKYGIEMFAFHVIEFLADSEFSDQFDHEQHYIDQLSDHWGDCYNIATVAVGGGLVGECNGRSTLTTDVVSCIKRDLFDGLLVDDIVVKYETTKKRVTNIQNGVSWTHVLPELNDVLRCMVTRQKNELYAVAVDEFFELGESYARLSVKYGLHKGVLSSRVQVDDRYLSHMLNRTIEKRLADKLLTDTKSLKTGGRNSGSKNSRALIDECLVVEIKNLMVQGLSNVEISNLTGVDKTKLSHIRGLRTWVKVSPELNEFLLLTVKNPSEASGKITEKQVFEIKNMMVQGLSNLEISNITGIDTMKISHIRSLRTWVKVSPELNPLLRGVAL